MSFPALKSIPITYNDLDIQETLCTGNLSIVQSAIIKDGGSIVALKKYDKLLLEKSKKIEEALMEKHILARLCHPNIVRSFASFSTARNDFLVTEICERGDLWKICRGWGHPDNIVRGFVSQLACAVRYMHRAGVIHRDIKAENIFVSNDLTLKLGDFGAARDMFNSRIKASSTSSFRTCFEHFVGTPNFMAPEAIANEANDSLSDIWSLGCTIYQILVGIPPFVASSEYFTFLRVAHRDILFPPTGISESAMKFVTDILTPKREARMTLEAMLTHPFMTTDPMSDMIYSPEDTLIMKICVGASHAELIEKCMMAQSIIDPRVLRRVLWAEEWRLKSEPGAGAAALLHLNLPELEEDYAYLRTKGKV